MRVLRRPIARHFLLAAACFASLSALSILLPATAVAAGAAGTLMEEMLVTVRKKGDAEVAQDIPITVTTFGNSQLEALFVQKLDDLSYSAPNVQLEQVGTFPGVQNFSIRGQGINSSIPSVDPTVGTFVNGVYMGTTYGVVIDMFDVETVEILRGPQGVLFGRNVTGGAVLLNTIRPDGEFGFNAKVTATADDRYGIAGAIQGALVPDLLFGRVAAYYDKDDGYFKNTNRIAPVPQPGLGMFDANGNYPNLNPAFPPSSFSHPSTGRNVGEAETYFVRPTLVLEPSDMLDLTLIGEFGHSEGDGATWGDVTGQRGEVGLGAGETKEFATNSEEVGTSDMDWSQVTLEINWDVGPGTLTNIAGWRNVEAFSITDIDGTFLPLFTASGDTDQDQFSNELRYFVTLFGDWDVTAGVYYFTQDIEYREGRYFAGGAGADFTGAPLMLPFPGANLALGGDMQHDSWGLFWNNDYRLTETVTLTAGIRYTDESKDAQIIDGPNPPAPPSPCLDVITFDCNKPGLKGDWDNWTPKLGADWRFIDNALVYAFWAQGVRSGGFNFRNARPAVIPPGPTKEEKQDSYEIGIKSDWFDNRLRANAAAFYNKVDDMQRELNVGDPVVVVLQGTVNAGDVTIKGIEFDVVALLTDSFSVDASLGIQNSKYDSINPTLAPGTIGADLPRLAPWNYSIGATWDIFLGDAGLITLRSNYGFRDKHYYDDANSQQFAAQRRLSASVNYTTPDEHWRVSIWGKNLKDEANYGNLTSIAGLYTAGPMQKGRDYGLEVAYTF